MPLPQSRMFCQKVYPAVEHTERRNRLHRVTRRSRLLWKVLPSRIIHHQPTSHGNKVGWSPLLHNRCADHFDTHVMGSDPPPPHHHPSAHFYWGRAWGESCVSAREVALPPPPDPRIPHGPSHEQRPCTVRTWQWQPANATNLLPESKVAKLWIPKATVKHRVGWAVFFCQGPIWRTLCAHRAATPQRAPNLHRESRSLRSPAPGHMHVEASGMRAHRGCVLGTAVEHLERPPLPIPSMNDVCSPGQPRLARCCPAQPCCAV